MKCLGCDKNISVLRGSYCSPECEANHRTADPEAYKSEKQKNGIRLVVLAGLAVGWYFWRSHRW